MKPVSFTQSKEGKTVIFFSDNPDWTAENSIKARLEFPGDLYDSFVMDNKPDWRIITDWLRKGDLKLGNKEDGTK